MTDRDPTGSATHHEGLIAVGDPDNFGTQTGRFSEQLTVRFGSSYATLVLLAARQRRTLTVGATTLDPLDIQDVETHLTKLRECESIQRVAGEVLRSTGVINDPAQADRLPDSHIRTMIDHLHADLGSLPHESGRHDVVSIDTAIARLLQARDRSQLGGSTVLHWGEENRALEPVARIELDADQDGAVVILSPDTVSR